MQNEYDDEMLEQINESVNLIEYVKSAHQEIELINRGNEYFAHCPKHIDKTPSLTFTASTNKYYCFSCGRGGGIIKYLMDYEDMSFDEAVQKAAGLAKMDIGAMCKSKTMIFLKKLHRKSLDSQTAKCKHDILGAEQYTKYSKEPVKEWIDEGIKESVLDLFDVRIDHLGNRIVYPVRDIHGNLINVKGRTRFLRYKEMKLPKYINYYPVGCMDYLQGLDITLPYVKESKEIIIFESIKSVMKAYGWGYKNCVSAEKHSLTDEQIELLLKLKVNVVFAYDSDISYTDKDVKRDIEKIKHLTNVYVINDVHNYLGGKDAKNAPVDLGEAVWKHLYLNKCRIL